MTDLGRRPSLASDTTLDEALRIRDRREQTKLRSLLVVYITVFVDILGGSTVLPVLSLYAQHFGAGSSLVGVVFSGFQVASFIGVCCAVCDMHQLIHYSCSLAYSEEGCLDEVANHTRHTAQQRSCWDICRTV